MATTFSEALRIMTQKFIDTDPGEYECPMAEYIESQMGWHDHSRCPETMALHWMGNNS